MCVVLKMIMRTNGKTPKLDDLIHQYLIIVVIVTVVIADNKTLFKCPGPSQWKFRAKSECKDTDKYICLFDGNGQKDEEFCGSWPDFENPGYKQILLGGTTIKPCSEDRYQPFIFWTNGSSKCVFKKENCNQEGQVTHNNGTLQTNRICRCDYTNNYDYVFKPKNGCFCLPSEEDCSCYVNSCQSGYILSRDYECLKESKLKYNCPELYRDSTDNEIRRTTIISSVEHVTPADSVEWSAVIVTFVCITAVLVLFVVYCLRQYRDTFGVYLKSRHMQDEVVRHYLPKKNNELQTRKNGLNKYETTCIIPKDVLDLQENEITKWRKKQMLFEETNASKKVSAEMKTNGFVIISGPPGSGKSAIAYNTAFMLEKNEEFKILPVSSPEEIRKYLLPETKQVFVIDDPVGKYTVDETCVQGWKNEETFIKQTFPACANTKLILTCRTYIYNSGFCCKLDVSPVHCDMLTENLKLSYEERKKIVHRYMYNIPVLNEDIIMMYDFFPLLCVSFSKHMETIDYFVNPCKVLTDEMISLKEHSDIAFLAIAFLVVRDSTIEKQMLTFANTETKDLLTDLCDECGFKYFPSTTVILSAVCNLIGTYVKEKDEIYSFIHDHLFRNISFIVGRYFIHCLLKYGSTDFWTTRLQFASLNEKQGELVISVSPEQEKSYFQRLILDVKKGYHAKVFTGVQMQFSGFRTILVRELRHLNSEDFKRDDKKRTFLHIAAEQGYEDFVYELVNLKRDQIDHRDIKGRTPLYITCLCGHKEAAQTLINFNASIDILCYDNFSPMDAAASKGHYSVVYLLLKEGVKVNRKDQNKRTALHRAIKNGHFDTVKLLIENKADIKQADKDGTKAIHEACRSGHLEIVKYLLKDNDLINDCDANGSTPLFIACKNNHIDIVGLLLDKSAKVNVKSNDGFTPLYIACLEGFLNVVQCLLIKKAEVNLPTKQGWTPLLISCSSDRLQICELLQKYGATINKGDISDLTPLHVACRDNHERIVRFLLDNNANVNAVDRQKQSPLYISCMNMMNDSSGIVELLLEKNANVNLCEEQKNSPLHAACRKGSKRIVQLLLDKKADKHKRNNAGKTPIDVVQGTECDKITEMLNSDIIGRNFQY